MWFGDDVVRSCIREQREHPEFIVPEVSIIAIKYGLNCIGDYREGELRSLGNHKDGVMGPWHLYGDDDSDEEEEVVVGRNNARKMH